jgi:hypothetical protein
METFGALKEQYRDRHLAVRRCFQPKKQTQGNGGSWKKLAATQGQLTHHDIPARFKDTVVRDKARTRLYQEPIKDGHSGRDLGRNQKASMEYGTKT